MRIARRSGLFFGQIRWRRLFWRFSAKLRHRRVSECCVRVTVVHPLNKYEEESGHVSEQKRTVKNMVLDPVVFSCFLERACAGVALHFVLRVPPLLPHPMFRWRQCELDNIFREKEMCESGIVDDGIIS